MEKSFKSAMKWATNKTNRKKKKLGIEIKFVCSLRLFLSLNLPLFFPISIWVYSVSRTLVDKFLQPEAAGFVKKDEYNYFWLSMHNDSDDVDIYINLLLDRLLRTMSSNNNRLPFNAQVLLNTINFLLLRHPTAKPSGEVEQTVLKWHKV